MTFRIPISIAIVALLAGACRTVNESPMTSSAVVIPDMITGSMTLNEPLSEILYLQLLNIEIASGIKVPGKQLHTSQGILQCHSDGILKTCYVRARLVDAVLSEREAAESDIIRAFWTHTAQTRPSVINEGILIANVRCDYVGPKSPPYNMEKVGCTVGHVRKPDESVLSGKDAATIAESLRGDQVTTDKDKTSLSGTVLCRSLGQQASTCLTRGYEGKDLSPDIRELDSQIANSLHNQLMQTHRDHAMLSSKGKKVIYSLPEEVMTRVKCTINLSQPKIFGGYICRMML